MTVYIDTTTLEFPINYGEIVRRHPGVTGPDTVPSNYALTYTDPPLAFDWATEAVDEGVPVFDGSRWLRQYTRRNRTEDELKEEAERMAEVLEAIRLTDRLGRPGIDTTAGSTPDVIG